MEALVAAHEHDPSCLFETALQDARREKTRLLAKV